MQSQQSSTLYGHPKGLFYLFFAELWERFSFYGMRALLVLYMTKQLLFTDKLSFGVYAAYMSLVYFTPLIGGILADRYLGYRRAIFIGGIFMALGHFLLTIETPLFFYLSLSLIIVGNGFFKPNISTFVGTLYKKEDSLRDAGFTIFYMGINIGGAVAPLLCAYLAELYGWHYGFMLAGIGMLVGLITFERGIKSKVFGDKGLAPAAVNVSLAQRWILLAAFLSVPLFALIVRYNEFEHYIIYLCTFFIIGYLIVIYKSVDSVAKKKLNVVVYFTVLMTLFWAIFEQAGSSLTLFADRNVNLIGINAAQTNSINSGFIIFLAIPFSMLWNFLAERKINPNSAIKSGFGLILLGLGFVIFALSARDADALSQTPMFYLIIGYFVLTLGEMFISPIGLSKMTELAPAKYLAFIMGVYFSSSFYGHFFAGKIAKMATVKIGEDNPLNEGIFGKISTAITNIPTDIIETSATHFQQLHSYVSVYAVFGSIAILVGVFALFISPIIKRWMHDVH